MLLSQELLDLNTGGPIYIMALDLPMRSVGIIRIEAETSGISRQEAGGRRKIREARQVLGNAFFLLPAVCLLPPSLAWWAARRTTGEQELWRPQTIEQKNLSIFEVSY